MPSGSHSGRGSSATLRTCEPTGCGRTIWPAAITVAGWKARSSAVEGTGSLSVPATGAGCGCNICARAAIGMVARISQLPR